jgi:hypothetical protein
MREMQLDYQNIIPFISKETWKSLKQIPIISVSQPTRNGHCNLLKQSNL